MIDLKFISTVRTVPILLAMPINKLSQFPDVRSRKGVNFLAFLDEDKCWHSTDLVVRRNIVAFIHVNLQKHHVGHFCSHVLHLRRYHLTGAAPRGIEVDHNQLVPSLLQLGFKVSTPRHVMARAPFNSRTQVSGSFKLPQQFMYNICQLPVTQNTMSASNEQIRLLVCCKFSVSTAMSPLVKNSQTFLMLLLTQRQLLQRFSKLTSRTSDMFRQFIIGEFEVKSIWINPQGIAYCFIIRVSIILPNWCEVTEGFAGYIMNMNKNRINP